MGGQSPQEQAAQQQYNDLRAFNPTVGNRFANYRPQFGYQDESNALDQQYNQMSNNLLTQSNADTAATVRGITQRLAAQGITGGSIMNNAITGAQNAGSKARVNALGNLKARRLSLTPGLMDSANNQQFAITNAAQNMDLQNMMNQFRKYGMVGQSIGGLDNTTWLDDALAGLNTAANVGKSVAAFF